jgi:hypothetical protein
MIGLAPTSVQNGGSARSYQELSAPLAISAKAWQGASWPNVYASPALGVNARICRRARDVETGDPAEERAFRHKEHEAAPNAESSWLESAQARRYWLDVAGHC